MIPRSGAGQASNSARREGNADRHEQTQPDPDSKGAPGLDVDRTERLRAMGVIVVTVRLPVIVRAVRLVGDVAGIVSVSRPVRAAAGRVRVAHLLASHLRSHSGT